VEDNDGADDDGTDEDGAEEEGADEDEADEEGPAISFPGGLASSTAGDAHVVATSNAHPTRKPVLSGMPQCCPIPVPSGSRRRSVVTKGDMRRLVATEAPEGWCVGYSTTTVPVIVSCWLQKYGYRPG
jgi:hypothetical protein